MSTTPTTMLEAVNELLTAIGTTPVNTLEVAGLTDAAIAKDTIERISREVQVQGWFFNTSKGHTLSPTGSQIPAPTNAVRISPALPGASYAGELQQFVLRENKLFNLLTNNFTFTQPVKVDVVWLLGFDQLPESARWYITVRSARIFQTKVLGNDQLGVFNSIHEQEAFQNLERDHLLASPSSIYHDRILQRFSRVRPDPIGHAGNAGGQQQRQE